MAAEPLPPGETTAALRAADAALRAGVLAAKILMALMAAGFLLSGMFFVEEGNVALRVRLGRPVGVPVGPGGPYFALPEPVDEVLRVSLALREVELRDAFWLDEHLWTGGRREPGWHVALLTADQNLVHARWTAVYRIPWRAGEPAEESAAMKFLRRAGTPERADAWVRSALERAAVHVLARTTVEDFYRGNVSSELVRERAQRALDDLGAGIELVGVALSERGVPFGVANDFLAAGRAESERDRQIERARQNREARLNEAAGAGYADLVAAIDAYEAAVVFGHADAASSARAEIDGLLFDSGLGGAAAAAIQQARAYRTAAAASVRGAAPRVDAMLAQYGATPGFYRERQVQDAIERIFRGNVETFHLPPGDGHVLYLEVGRN